MEPLEPDHVVEIIDDSTTFDTMDEPAFPFVRSLEDQHCHRLAETIIKWTAGAPRPLLYALHMLELSAKDFGDLYKSEQGLRQMFGLIVEYVKTKRALFIELGPVAPRSRDLSRDEEMAYDYLCLVSWLGKPVNLELKLSQLEKPLETYLRSFNIFAHRDDSSIKLVAPLTRVQPFGESYEHYDPQFFGHFTASCDCIECSRACGFLCRAYFTSARADEVEASLVSYTDP